MRLRNLYFFIFDVFVLALTPVLALGLRLDTIGWPEEFRAGLSLFIGLALVVKLPVFYSGGLYRRYWPYATFNDFVGIVITVILASGLTTAIFLGVIFAQVVPGVWLPRSVPFLDWVLTLMVVGGSRFGVRALVSLRQALGDTPTEGKRRALIAGAGEAGAMIVREMHTSRLSTLHPVGFVDDDPHKRGVSIHGLPVLGALRDIPAVVAQHGVDEVVIAMPSVPGRVIRKVVALCEKAQVPSQTMPGLSEILSGRVGVNPLRNVEIQDLLRREPVNIDSAEVTRMLVGMRVLVTGAGGSIGSELCRQIARSGPARLTILGHGENSLFLLDHELRRRWPNETLDVVVADIRDRPRLESVFGRFRPQVVFHASAHKHVPLMELNCEDAVTNNVAGTRNVVGVSEAYGVERFVFISSDKAVNPANVMGATKRIAEMIVQDAARRTAWRYVSVRFGNVLGSRGSVVPLFREQIALGGPVTVTHPDIRRYFMTIPEAVQLVLQAAALAAPDSQGEVFVLDMGEPVAIVDLARDLIELSGLHVGSDIDIVFTGLRPGEKLHEELFVEGEEYYRTRHEKIMAARAGHGGAAAHNHLDAQLDRLIEAARAGAEVELRRLLREIVPNYLPSTAVAPQQIPHL